MKKKVLCRYYSKNTTKHLKNNTNSTLIYFGKKKQKQEGNVLFSLNVFNFPWDFLFDPQIF